VHGLTSAYHLSLRHGGDESVVVDRPMSVGIERGRGPIQSGVSQQMQSRLGSLFDELKGGKLQPSGERQSARSQNRMIELVEAVK
jgi:hypothetical protein